jgi:hypothetical protein
MRGTVGGMYADLQMVHTVKYSAINISTCV